MGWFYGAVAIRFMIFLAHVAVKALDRNESMYEQVGQKLLKRAYVPRIV